MESLLDVFADEKMENNLISRCYRDINPRVISDSLVSRRRVLNLNDDGTLSFEDNASDKRINIKCTPNKDATFASKIDSLYEKGNFLIYHLIRCHIRKMIKVDKAYKDLYDYCNDKINTIQSHFAIIPKEKTQNNRQEQDEAIH